jgi:hypothetical protein
MMYKFKEKVRVNPRFFDASFYGVIEDTVKHTGETRTYYVRIYQEPEEEDMEPQFMKAMWLSEHSIFKLDGDRFDKDLDDL